MTDYEREDFKNESFIITLYIGYCQMSGLSAATSAVFCFQPNLVPRALAPLMTSRSRGSGNEIHKAMTCDCLENAY